MLSSFKSNGIKNDLLWYVIGALLPMAVLMLRSPIFTRFFSPADYGHYTLVYLVFLYLSAIKLEWIRSSVWRYYLRYKKRGILHRFHASISFLFVISCISVLLISFFWMFFTTEALIKQLILVGALHTISQECITILLISHRVEGRSKFYNLINSSRIGISFLLLLYLTFFKDWNISAFFLAPTLVNVIYLFFLIPRSSFASIPSFSLIKFVDIKRFFRYGMAGAITMLSTFILISADRWFIHYFWGLEKTGIYNQTYILAQMSIMALIAVINASLNPYLINNLEKNRIEADIHVDNAFRWFVYFVFPLGVYLAIFAYPVSTILLGPKFREAWMIIPWISFAFVLEGMCHFSSIKLKFFNRLGFLYTAVVVAGVFNVLLNYILIPVYGYQTAAYTTFVSYVILFVFYYVAAESKFLHKSRNLKFLFLVVTILLLQVAVHLFLKSFLEKYNLFLVSIVEGVLFLATYYFFTKKVSPIHDT